MTATKSDADGAIHDSNPAAGGARTSPSASPSPRTTEHPEGGGQGAAPSPSGDARIAFGDRVLAFVACAVVAPMLGFVFVVMGLVLVVGVPLVGLFAPRSILNARSRRDRSFLGLVDEHGVVTERGRDVLRRAKEQGL